jgi:putative phosphoesterase
LKRIALISDTHGYLDPKLFKHIESCDEIWHAGDIGTLDVINKLAEIKPVIAVYGNIDGQEIRSAYPKIQYFKCEDMWVLITHIGGYPGKYSTDVRTLISEKKTNIFICGHSHILKVMFDKKYNLLHMNPGACGNHGFHKVKTLLRFTIDKDKIKDLEVIELGYRNIL